MKSEISSFKSGVADSDLSLNPETTENETVDKVTVEDSKEQKQAKENHRNEDECPICLKVMNEMNIAYLKECGHKFCEQCITEWAKGHDACPCDQVKFQLVTIVNRLTGGLVRNVVSNMEILDSFIVDDNTIETVTTYIKNKVYFKSKTTTPYGDIISSTAASFDKIDNFSSETIRCADGGVVITFVTVSNGLTSVANIIFGSESSSL